MALYNYSLFLVREAGRGAFVDELAGAGLATRAGDELELLGTLACRPRITPVAEGLTSVEITPGDGPFERVLAERGREFLAWLWRVIEASGVVYAFIPGGDDVKYEEQGVPIQRFQWTQLPEMLDTGAVRVVHPFMFFAERLGHGRPYAKAKATNWGLNEDRPGVGCVMAFAELSETGFEIIEPGTLYPTLKASFA